MIRDFVEDSARRSTLPEADLTKLQHAVDEACANVIEHAYDNDDTREITIHVWFDDRQIEVDVIDSGSPFDPGSHNPIRIEDLVGHTGGRALRTMRLATEEPVSDTRQHRHH